MSDPADLRRVSALTYDDGAWQVHRHDASQPLLSAFDYAATRGDGAFEAMHVLDGVANKPERHLERMARSLQHLAIVGPPYADWKALIADLIDQWPPGVEGVLKLVISRGLEGGPATQNPTVYGTMAPLEQSLLDQRRDGITVITRTLGYPAQVRAVSPWLLGGTKYLSYAINMAARREATAHGADDIIFISTDGEVLEGPNSTVVWLRGDTLHTPPSTTGILRGTTQELIFSRAMSVGLHTSTTDTEIADLTSADGVWLTSSTRGVAAVRSLDGSPLNQSPRTVDLQRLSGLPVPAGAGGGQAS